MRELNKEALFSKDNISRNMKMMRDMIVKPIPLLCFAIAMETAKSRSRLKFFVLIRPKENEIGKTKGAQVMQSGGEPKKGS